MPIEAFDPHVTQQPDPECEHQWEAKVLGNCWRRYTCTRCKGSYEVDSSG